MYTVDVSGSGVSPLVVKSKDYSFLVDVHGGGITPPDTLLAGLASCIGVYIRKYIEGTKLPVSDFTVHAEGELSKEKPIAFREIRVTIDIKGSQIDEHRIRALLEFVKNCPVHNTLHSNPSVVIALA